LFLKVRGVGELSGLELSAWKRGFEGSMSAFNC
jgi:hypothetical protein